LLLTLKIDGQDELAIPKAIQRDPIKGIYRHVDLLTVRRGEEDPPSTSGCSSSARSLRGGLLAQEHMSVSVEADATNLPSEIEVDIAVLEIGTQIKASDLALPPASPSADARRLALGRRALRPQRPSLRPRPSCARSDGPARDRPRRVVPAAAPGRKP